MDKKPSLRMPNVEDQKGVLPKLIDTEVIGERSAADPEKNRVNEAAASKSKKTQAKRRL
jgi:hypothetical protein